MRQKWEFELCEYLLIQTSLLHLWASSCTVYTNYALSLIALNVVTSNIIAAVVRCLKCWKYEAIDTLLRLGCVRSAHYALNKYRNKCNKTYVEKIPTKLITFGIHNCCLWTQVCLEWLALSTHIKIVDTSDM